MRFLPPDAIAAAGGQTVDEIAAATVCVVAAGEGELRGNAAAALLFSSYAVVSSDATIAIDSPEAWAGAVWRSGRRAIQLVATGAFSAADALAAGLVDEILPEGGSFDQWLAAWMQNRSEAALDAGAALVRMRGGDPLERAVFARLFATGAPQEGLRAFLDRKK